MSGLLVKSTLIMKENLELMNERGITVPVVLGGAALNRRYVDDDLRSLYQGPLFYARDAFAGLHTMDKLASENGGQGGYGGPRWRGSKIRYSQGRETQRGRKDFRRYDPHNTLGSAHGCTDSSGAFLWFSCG